MSDEEAWERAEEMARAKGYISLWSLPRERREQMIQEAKRVGSGMSGILEAQKPDYEDGTWV